MSEGTEVYVVQANETIIGVFDDEKLANDIYDALDRAGANAYLETYTINTIKKGT